MEQQQQQVTHAGYDPNRLLDTLIERTGLVNDAALSRRLRVAHTLISKIRHRRVPVSASMLIRMHDITGIDVRELREFMGDRRTNFRISDVEGKPRHIHPQASPDPDVLH